MKLAQFNHKFATTLLVLFTFGCTSTNEQQSIRFALIADPQMGFSKPQKHKHTDFAYFSLAVSKINDLKEPAEFVLILGDMVQNQADETNQWPDYQSGVEGLSIPYYEVMGNHDGWNPTGLDRWRNRWNKKDYYSFTHQGVYFMALNSYFFKKPQANIEEANKQKDFIATELDKHTANPHKFIFQHFPLFIDDPNEAELGNRNLPLNERRFLLEQIEKHHINAVFNGHTHYQNVIEYQGTTLLSANPTSRTLGKGKRGFYVVDYDKTTSTMFWQFIHLTEAELTASFHSD